MAQLLLASILLTWDEYAVLPVTVVSVAVALGLFLWWHIRRSARVPLPPPAEEAAPLAVEESEPEAPDSPPAEGPGQLLVRFQSLNNDFEQATKELQRYNGSREVQLQGWQQLSSDIIRRILPVLDNLEPYLDDSDSSVSDVAQLAYGRLLTELVTIGVTQIIPSPGEPFNGKYHVLGPDSMGYPPYQIKSVVQPGYRFQPRIPGASEIVLKPAEVIVESIVVEQPEEESVEEIEIVRAPVPVDDDEEDTTETRRMPPPEDDDDEDDTEVRRMPPSLTEER